MESELTKQLINNIEQKVLQESKKSPIIDHQTISG